MPGYRVLPAGEDGFWGDQGEKAGRVFGYGKEGMESLLFVGEEAVGDTAQFEVAAVVLVFKPEKRYFRDRGMVRGKKEYAKTEEGQEKVEYWHGCRIT
jgi:hypothetical protein